MAYTARDPPKVQSGEGYGRGGLPTIQSLPRPIALGLAMGLLSIFSFPHLGVWLRGKWVRMETCPLGSSGANKVYARFYL